MMQWFFVLVLIGCCWADSPIRYDNYQVYRVLPTNMRQLNVLRGLENQDYHFWAEATRLNQYTDIMVAPAQKAEFEEILNFLKLEKNIMIPNVQELINKEQNNTMARLSTFNWKSYQTLEQIHSWLQSLEQQYPDKVKVIVGGKTYEGRNIYGVHVSFKPGNRAIFLEGGIHAREWISPATVTYILNELLSSTDPKVRAVVESHDWYVFPNFNPDGYEYTHKTNRMWRKTRKPYPGCYGADPNRNWDYHWMEGGASSFPCLDTHAGSSAFSEIETKSMSEFITSIASSLDGYISFHSYSQLLLIPFGHKGLEVPSNNDELHRVGQLAAKKLEERYGTRYTVDNIPQAIYVASGSSTDWVAGVHKVKMVYTFELRDNGRYGFLLPADQIIPTGEETFDALVVMVEEFNA